MGLRVFELRIPRLRSRGPELGGLGGLPGRLWERLWEWMALTGLFGGVLMGALTVLGALGAWGALGTLGELVVVLS